MGPPGAFKSTSWKMLAEAMKIKDPENAVKVVDVNPKTMPTQDLQPGPSRISFLRNVATYGVARMP